MNLPPENSHDPRSRPKRESEDPHYHDDDLPLGDDPPAESPRFKAPGKPRRKIPPSRRWYRED